MITALRQAQVSIFQCGPQIAANGEVPRLRPRRTALQAQLLPCSIVSIGMAMEDFRMTPCCALVQVNSMAPPAKAALLATELSSNSHPKVKSVFYTVSGAQMGGGRRAAWSRFGWQPLGTTGRGTVFKLGAAGKLTVRYAFTGGTDGGQPEGGLLRDHAGNLYGTTTGGGDLTCRFGLGCGVVFKIAPNGKETVLYAFTGGQDGVQPSGDLIRDRAGNFYGVTEFGGTSSDGILFEVTPSGKETVLYTFSGGATGYAPTGRLARDDEGNIYGYNLRGWSSVLRVRSRIQDRQKWQRDRVTQLHGKT